TLGQLAIGAIGTQGAIPFIAVLALLLIAVLPPLFFKQGQPQCHEHKSLSLKQISRLNKASLVGCMVSGVVMGSIYGMMPLALNQGQFNTDQIGVLMAAIILGGLVVQLIISKLSVMMSKTLLLAMMCLVGVFAMGMTYLSNDYVVLI
ncbi:MFS transporter, partial [Klebsiella oxytoca]